MLKTHKWSRNKSRTPPCPHHPRKKKSVGNKNEVEEVETAPRLLLSSRRSPLPAFILRPTVLSRALAPPENKKRRPKEVSSFFWGGKALGVRARAALRSKMSTQASRQAGRALLVFFRDEPAHASNHIRIRRRSLLVRPRRRPCYRGKHQRRNTPETTETITRDAQKFRTQMRSDKRERKTLETGNALQRRGRQTRAQKLAAIRTRFFSRRCSFLAFFFCTRTQNAEKKRGGNVCTRRTQNLAR